MSTSPFAVLLELLRKFAVLSLILLLGGVSRATEYHVSPMGDDAASGTAAAPYRTVSRAARVLKPGDTCLIHTGVYRETVTLTTSGEPNNPIRLAAVGDGPVVISGTDPLTVNWSPHTDNIYVADIKPAPSQLFIDGTMAREAHWPNGAYGDLMDRPCVTAEAGTGYEGIVCGKLPQGDFNGGYVLIWRGGAWTNATVRIKDYKPGKSLAFETPFKAHSDKYHKGDAFKPKAGNRFLLLGCMAALDAPGEWLVSPDDGRVYFRPPDGRAPGELRLEVKKRDYVLVLKGCNYITLRGLHFDGGAIDMTDANHCLLEECEITYSNHFTRTAKRVPPHPMNKIKGNGNTLRKCRIAYAAGTSFEILGENNTITNSVLHDLGYMGTYEAALQIVRSKGTVIDRCSIYRAGRGLIQHHGAERMRITHCDLHHANMLSNDVGATYAWGTDGKGSVIAYNWVHHNLGSNTAGIYLDNFCRNFQVHHNVVWQTQSTAIRLNCDALGHLVANNTVAQSPKAFSTFAYHRYEPNQKGTRLVNNLLLCRFDPDDSHYVISGEKGASLEANLGGAVDRAGVPTAGSAAIDTGVPVPGITDGYVGRAPDVGAYERGAPYWRPGADWDPNPTAPELAFTPQPPVSEANMPQEGLLLWLDATATDTHEVENGVLIRWHDRRRNGRVAKAGPGLAILANACNGRSVVRCSGEGGLDIGTLRKNADGTTVFLVARSEEDGGLPWQRIFVSWTGTGQNWVTPSFIQMRPNAKSPTPFPPRLFTIAPRTDVVLDHITVATSPNEKAQSFVGDIAEVLVFGQCLDFDIQEAIANYLRTKWGI